nr:hypothetical protein K-LCC10_0278 [Kaumoebavirus]
MHLILDAIVAGILFVITSCLAGYFMYDNLDVRKAEIAFALGFVTFLVYEWCGLNRSYCHRHLQKREGA